MVFFLITALTLFLLSIYADRKLHNENLTRLFFYFLAMILLLWIEIFILESLWDDQMLEGSFIDGMKVLVSKFGGWSPLIAVFYFIGAFVIGIMALLSRFLDSVEAISYWVASIMCLVSGLVFLVGFWIFFEKFALILGVIATIISIILGVKKLGSKNQTD